MNSLNIYTFRQDYSLRLAYAAHEAVLEAFQKAYKRQPTCGLFVGSSGERDSHRSSVTARWTNGETGAKDAALIHTLAETVKYTT